MTAPHTQLAYTLEEAAPLFGCDSAKALQTMSDRGQLPVPITELTRPNSKRHPKVILVEHLTEYLSKMGEAAKAKYTLEQQQRQQ